MGNKDYKFDAHKGFESFWAQAMMYSMILKDRYEPDTYICSPLRAETLKRLEMNVSAVRAYMSYAIMEMGFSATAPHAFLPMVLNDDVPEEREIALKFGLILLKRCKRLFVCGGHISPGMLGEITHAFNLGKEIRVFNRGVYGAIKEIAEKNGYDLDLLVYDTYHRYLSLSAAEIIPHDDDGERRNYMEIFSMIDIVGILGLPYPKHNEQSYNIHCPCCDDPKDPRNKHLNINLRKNVFCCPKCGLGGGMFDMYAYFANVPRKDVYKELCWKMGKNQGQSGEPRKNVPTVPPVTEEIESPLMDIESRHATYTALLSKLSLAKDHRDNLRGRGLLDEEIDKLGYKTTPVAGMSMMAKQLRSDGYYLAGVPGFYRKENGDWTFINESRGILIPVRDQRGMIQGLQIRRDNTEKRKFRWVSSTDRKDGCKAEGWAHLSGTISEQMILTEGPMKADVIHALTGISVIAVPGVNTLTQLKVMLEALRDEGVVRIRTAFDMDFTTNYHVQNGFKNLLSLLDGMGFKFGTYVWDSRYKGLDDFIWESMMKKTRGGAGD